MTIMKNPYDSGSPEWQLFENATSSKSLSDTYSKEANAKLLLSQQQRTRYEAFAKALAILDPSRAMI